MTFQSVKFANIWREAGQVCVNHHFLFLCDHLKSQERTRSHILLGADLIYSYNSCCITKSLN